MSLGGHKSQSTTDVRLNSININQSSYGNCIPLVYGQNRIPLTLLWYGNFIATPHTATQSGGKGGGGGSSNTTFTYSASMIMGLCEGPMAAAVGQVWQDKVVTTLAALGFTAFSGAGGQATWSYLTTNFSSQAVPYDHTAYVAVANYALGSDAGIPNFTFEVTGFAPYNGTTIPDAEPSAILLDYCTDPNHGAGFSNLSSAMQGTGVLTYQSYCIAMGFFISPYESTQRTAVEFVKEILQITNSDAFLSAGVLNIVPYADASVTGNSRVYTPNLTPLFSFGDDDFMPGTTGSAADPVVVDRKPLAQTYNTVRIEYLDRSNAYNTAIAEATDAQDIALNGVRVMATLTFHSITTGAVAKVVAQLICQRQLYIRNQYTFNVRADYCLLEPMDLVAITDSNLGISNKLVRVIEVDDDENDNITLVCEDMLVGAANAPLYNFQAAQGYAANYGVTPPSVGTPVLFAAPPLLIGPNGGYEIWAALDQSAAGSWGGCDVYTSLDNVSYIYAGTMNGASRCGLTTNALPATADPDTTDTLGVALTNASTTSLQLVSGSAADYQNLRTLIYIDGEIMAYQTATLVSAGTYNLTNLRRGLYGSTVAAHAAGSQFVRIDAGVFQMPYDVGMTGQTMYFKFCSFNLFGRQHQSLATATAYSHVLANTNAGQLQPSALTLVGSGVTISANTAFKSASTLAWDSSVYSTQSYVNGCSVSCYPAQSPTTSGTNSFMVGLTTNPTASNNYPNLNYAFQADGNLNIYIYESGSLVSTFAGYTSSTLLNIVYDGKYVSYFISGACVRTVPLAAATFFAQICFYGPGTAVYGIDFTPVTTSSAALTLNNFNSNSVCTGSRAQKVSGANAAWNASCYSSQSYGNGCTLSFQAGPQSTDSMAGLVISPTSNVSYIGANYAFETYGGGGNTWNIYETGANTGVTGTYTAATLFTILYDGKHVQYFVNGLLVRTVPLTNTTFYAATYHAYLGDSIVNLDFGPAPTAVTPFTLVPLSTTVVAAGNMIATGPQAVGSWGTKMVKSNQSFTSGVSVSAQLLNTPVAYICFGLSTAPATNSANAAGTGFAAAFYLAAPASVLQCLIGTSVIYAAGPAPVVGDVFTITYDNYFYYFYKNGVLLIQYPAPSVGALFFLADLYTVGGGLNNIAFGAYGALSPNPFVATVSCVTNDSTAGKLSTGAGAWDSAVYSINGYTTCHLSFKAAVVAAQYYMVGLATNPKANSSYTNLAYCWYNSAGTWTIYEAGSLVNNYAAVALTDTVSITYDGSTVTYYINGTSIRTVSVSGLTLYMSSSFNSPGSQIQNLSFGPGTGTDTYGTSVIDANSATTVVTSSVSGVNVGSSGVSSVTNITSVSVGPFPVATTVVVSCSGSWSNPSSSSAGTVQWFLGTASTGLGSIGSSTTGAASQVGVIALEYSFALAANTAQTYYMNGLAGTVGVVHYTVTQVTLKAEVIKR